MLRFKLRLLFLAVLSASAAADEPGPRVVVARDAIQPHVAIDAKGKIYAVFIRNGSIELSMSDDQGKTFSPPSTAIDGKGKATGGLQRGPRVAVDGMGVVYVTAPLCFDPAEFSKRYPVRDLYLAVSKDGGKSFSKPARVNDVPKKAPEALHWLAASPRGGAHVAWLDLRLGRPRTQSLAYTTIKAGSAKAARNKLVVPGPLCECCAPGIAVDGKGNPVVVWREGGQKSSREIFLALSRNGGRSFGRAARINRGKTGAAT